MKRLHYSRKQYVSLAEIGIALPRDDKSIKGKLADIVDRLEELGENDMGDLTHAQARAFHNATSALRKLWGRLPDQH
jgi:hypothetical protein